MNTTAPSTSRWSAFAAAVVRGYHAYGGWLVTISWWKFIALSLLLMIMSGILQNIPPFNIRLPTLARVDETAAPPTPPRLPRPDRILGVQDQVQQRILQRARVQQHRRLQPRKADLQRDRIGQGMLSWR